DISRVTQGIWGGRIIRNNVVHDCCNSHNSKAHENGAWIQNTADVYNNIWRDCYEGVGLSIFTGWGNRANRTLRMWNNVIWDTPQIRLSTEQNPDTSNE